MVQRGLLCGRACLPSLCYVLCSDWANGILEKSIDALAAQLASSTPPLAAVVHVWVVEALSGLVS
ncbi:hypothetical protein DDE83_008881 [Stemphylium lycopersici]|uniref:Uncharacterized protein n=1 Tax=Stemphylium lycopersici TaxID=183478 RepID=A0A364MRZ0_STELY|nr:hypothetical protein DDE83_008881 [Stemphylium lycopersici]